jgi:hypothetical protein
MGVHGFESHLMQFLYFYIKDPIFNQHFSLFKNKKHINFTKFVIFQKASIYQLSVGSVIIDAELGREHHGSIPHNYNREGAGTT